MSPREQAALDFIASAKSVHDVKTIMKHAAGKSPDVHRAAFERVIDLSVIHHGDPVARACWKMVLTIEQVRRESGRKVARMNRLRPKIEKEGEGAALEYCATHQTDGFQEVVDYGLPEYTAEAIVLGFPDRFPNAQTRRIARERLGEAGIDPSRFDGNPII